jgi:hypothetical protein
MPKDNTLPVDGTLEHSPVGGLSDPLYNALATADQPMQWTRSPIGGLSLDEFLRIIAQAT